MKSTVDIVVSSAPILDYCNLKPQRLKHNVFKRFIDDLNKDRKKDITFFLNNLETVKLKRISNKDGITKTAVAQYAIKDNTIEIIDHDNFDTVIDHELLHMSSSILDEEENLYSGFSQTHNDLSIGVGLNEGYTSLLDDRYFIHRTKDKEETNERVYRVVKSIARNIEAFIGQEKMEDLYFKADLLTLCRILSKYTSMYETINFLHNVDLILIKYEQANIMNYPLCFKKYSECMLYICEAWMYRITEGYYNKQITKDEYSSLLNMVRSILNERLSIDKTFIKSVKLDKYYEIMQNKVNKKLTRKYNLTNN